MDADKRPAVSGKHDLEGKPLLPENYELNVLMVARAFLERLQDHSRIEPYLKKLETLEQTGRKGDKTLAARTPFYCSGCPHNTSTTVPEGSRALAGIGCHYMAMWIKERTDPFTQMGGEGVPWIGQAPFSKDEHVFANLGDGTYFHSGLLAVRACVSGKVNITFKILYNDAVAMTGGQPVDGSLSVPEIAAQVRAEGVKNIIIVSDDIEKYKTLGYRFPEGTQTRHRDELMKTQIEMRDMKGVSVLIYDQTCAAEKRRRRKRGLMEDPAKRIFINERVCEGCGDCSKKSNCVSVLPVETDYGRKRQIDQSSCNKDYSCVKGFCPSFVTILGGDVKKPVPKGGDVETLAEKLIAPKEPKLTQPYSILVTGVGGTGVVTIGALLAMAAHLEGKGCSTMDQTGLAQKGGAVTSHVKIAQTPEAIHSVRVSAGCADLVLGCDLIVAANPDSMQTMSAGVTKAILNGFIAPPGDFTRQPDLKIPDAEMVKLVADRIGEGAVTTLDATGIASALLGNSIATNLFIVGYAWQKGLIPLSQRAIMKAIELNGASVKMNQRAFLWGRLMAQDPAQVLEQIKEDKGDLYAYRKKSETLDELISRRVADLTAYQNASYAARYQDFITQVREAEAPFKNREERLSKAVAKYLFKLMAYKDEYEVARFYTDGLFEEQIKDKFEGNIKLKFNLAPPLFAKRDKATGELLKSEFGPWVFKAFKLLSKLKFLRGTPFDLFGHTEERKTERRLIEEYRATIADLLPRLNAENYHIAVMLAEIPEEIRGYGHVKEEHLTKARQHESALKEQFFNPLETTKKAA